MSCSLVSFLAFPGSNSYKRGCKSLGSPPSLEPRVAAQGLVSARSKWDKPLSNDAPWHGNFRTYLTSLWDGHFLPEPLLPSLQVWPRDNKSECHGGFPIFPKHPLPWGTKTREEEEFLSFCKCSSELSNDWGILEHDGNSKRETWLSLRVNEGSWREWH